MFVVTVTEYEVEIVEVEILYSIYPLSLNVYVMFLAFVIVKHKQNDSM